MTHGQHIIQDIMDANGKEDGVDGELIMEAHLPQSPENFEEFSIPPPPPLPKRIKRQTQESHSLLAEASSAAREKIVKNSSNVAPTERST